MFVGDEYFGLKNRVPTIDTLNWCCGEIKFKVSKYGSVIKFKPYIPT